MKYSELSKRQQRAALKRIEEALRYHRKHRPALTTPRYVRDLGLRFGIGRKDMAYALDLMNGAVQPPKRPRK